MTRTVDLVIVGGTSSATAAAMDAATRGLRVLVVIGATGRRAGSRFRQALRRNRAHRRVRIMTGAEVVCVDGVDTVEAVVIRRKSSGRLIAFNTSGILKSPKLKNS